MNYFDVFNGDADGLCALQQLRLSCPVDALPVTGVKRDIALLQRVEAQAGDRITVLDVSLDKNREPLLKLLEQGISIQYFDHHFAGDIPCHPLLESHIETLPDKGTSLLVDDYLGGAQRAWAVVGTFGDNFDSAAHHAAKPLRLDPDELALLRELGIVLNYNGYGETIDDLHIAPDELFRRIAPYADPLDFAREDATFAHLRDGFAQDIERARAVAPERQSDQHMIVILPSAAWARRASGVYANELAQAAPGRAHALLTRLVQGGFVVSVRAPLARAGGADRLCRKFPSGGGRRAAAGINYLPEEDFGRFTDAFLAAFQA